MAKFALLFCIIFIVVIQIANTSAGRVARETPVPDKPLVDFDKMKATVTDLFSEDNIKAGKAKAAEFGENVANVFKDLTDKATEQLKKLKK